jgi:branched-chain amino acid transport system permease protein
LTEKPNLAVTFIICLLMSAFLGLLMHFLVFRPLRNSPTLGKVIGSIGVFLYLSSMCAVHFGGQNRYDEGFSGFNSTSGAVKNFLGLGGTIPRSNFFLFGAALVMCLAVWALYRYSRFGIATRAADENEKGAALLGYSPQFLAGANWVLASVTAGVAGILFLHKTQPAQIALFVVGGLGAALFGNLTSIPGATMGGLIIGMIASGGVELTTNSWWPDIIPGDGVRNFMPLLIIILVLYFRGDKLPIRGSISIGRQPRAPTSNNVIIGAIAALGIGLLLSNIFVSKWEAVLTTTIIAIVFMYSLTVLIGFLGQISLVQWTISGLAAYTMIRLMADGTKIRETDFVTNTGWGWPTVLAFIAAIVVAVVFGLLVGLPALRIRGVQLAVVTIAAVIAVESLLLRNPPLMGDGSVSVNPTPSPNWFGQYVGGFNPNTARTDYWKFSLFIIILAGLIGVGVANLRRGQIGRRFLAIRANERAAAAAGINVANMKLLGFGISSGIAAIAGCMLAYKLPGLQTDQFEIFGGLALLAFAYLGGITTVWGAIVGGCLIAGGLMPEFLGVHFESVDTGLINAVGAIGLVVNAKVTNGEGVALLQTDLAKNTLAALRREPDQAEEADENANNDTEEVTA